MPSHCRLDAALALAAAMACSADVAVRQEGGAFHVKAPSYEAVVGSDGCLSSFSTDGMEFLKSTPDNIPRGMYLYQKGLHRVPEVTQPEPLVVMGRSDKSEIRYQFAPDKVTVTIENVSPDTLSYVGVFDPSVGVVTGDGKRYHKTPVTKPWPTTLWFRDRASLRIGGEAGRIWGPWSGNHQVWQADVKPGATAGIELTPGTATEEQIDAAVAKAAAPPPPPPSDPVGPMWDMAKLVAVPETAPAEGFESGNARAVFYAGLPYEGMPTRVFAWIGMPDVDPGTKVPGVVLVHGGGGTAFASWVKRWTSRGYAAIAMDTCGCVPRGRYGHWERHDAGGPPGWGGWGQIDEPREDQWTYHAVADAILAHSLLLSVPDVDPERTGLTGISWGGYLTSIIAGVDHRFKFAVPVYGCGFTNEHGFAGSVSNLGKERGDRWMRWWDPSAYLADAPMPMLWVTGSNDFAYTMNALQKSYRLPSGPRALCVRLRMPHGHGDAGEGPKEIFAFADSILKQGIPLLKVTGQGRDGRDVRATFQGECKVRKAELNVTSDTGRWQDRKWHAVPATVSDGNRVTATLPEGTTVYYLNLFDERDCVVSTEHEEVAP